MATSPQRADCISRCEIARQRENGRNCHRWTVLITAILTFYCAQVGHSDDGVTELRAETRGTGPERLPTPKSTPQPDSPSNYDPSKPIYLSSDENDEESGVESFETLAGGILVAGVVYGVSAPFWGPAKLVEDDYLSPGFFPRYPYQMPVDGHLMIDPYIPRKPKSWAGRIQAEYGGDFDDLNALNFGLLMETTSRFGVDAWAHQYSQEAAPGRIDDLWLGDANLLFRFAQSPKLEMRTGVGINWLSDDAGSEFGFNFTYGGDWYPMNPLIVSSELDWGELGHASLFHLRTTAGVHYHRGELYVGYDYLDVGNAQLDTWIIGLRFWF